jgi:hypothetical protein
VTWLKKLGTIVLKIVGIATGLMPLISQELPAKDAAVAGTVVDKLNQGLGVIVTTEQMFTAVSQASGQGSAKLQAATPFIAGLIQQTDMLAGKKPKDEAAFQAACTKITSGFADVLNSFGE